MIVGLVQTAPQFGDRLANQKQIENLTADLDADLWIAPELALTGYEFRNRAEAMELAEEVPAGPTCVWLQDFCRDRNCLAVLGLSERDGDKVYNAAVLMSPEGLLGRYRKIHLFDAEKLRFDPGNLPFSVFDTGKARIGLMICFDWRFPEAARTLALRGAQIIAHPSNLVMPFCQKAMVTRALENNVFCATANRIGEERRTGRIMKFTGGSQIVAPDGEVLRSCACDATVAFILDIDPRQADNKKVGPYNNVHGDRRPEFYAP
jgi:predicted amidohydrolase